ncbi:PREDICTED: glutathione S-transferase T2-like [Brassica oleracea var. oleracea]|uniref:glutathione S-transferase T2-like n=1 Tax=Brassica oleracea var. oleracea TaxID=109376 RepID=UPI0006A6A2AF|nr:PREDICTED: glutathione S-transferase T2-like [Brassica oleracea var. oleracea]
MDTTPGFVNLLNNQSSFSLDSPEPIWFSTEQSIPMDTPPVSEQSSSKERRKWSIKEDRILISAWLNTSKDSVVGNEQKATHFWRRIVEYYNSSPQLVGTIPRELGQCKQRWARINDLVCKFVGSYEAALREQRSGKNDDDVMKAALDIFFNDYSIKFTLEHAWRELRHDKKWCSAFLFKDKRKQPVEVDGEDAVAAGEARLIGVKATKASIKRKKSGREEELEKIQCIMEMKEKISKRKVVQGHGCERKSRVCFVVFPFTGVKEVTGVKFHFYK